MSQDCQFSASAVILYPAAILFFRKSVKSAYQLTCCVRMHVCVKFRPDRYNCTPQINRHRCICELQPTLTQTSLDLWICPSWHWYLCVAAHIETGTITPPPSVVATEGIFGLEFHNLWTKKICFVNVHFPWPFDAILCGFGGHAPRKCWCLCRDIWEKNGRSDFEKNHSCRKFAGVIPPIIATRPPPVSYLGSAELLWGDNEYDMLCTLIGCNARLTQ